MFLLKADFEKEIKRINSLLNRILRSHEAKVRAYLGSSQLNIPNATWTRIKLNTVFYDTKGGFDTANNYYVIPVSGFYLAVARVTWANIQAGRYIVSINDGSDRTIHEDQLSTVNNYIAFSFSDILFLNKGSNVALYAYQNTGGNTPGILAGIARTFLALLLIE